MDNATTYLATSTDRLGRQTAETPLAAFPEQAARSDARALGRYLRAAGVLVAGQCVIAATQLSPSCWRVIASRTGGGPSRVLIERVEGACDCETCVACAAPVALAVRPRVYLRAECVAVSL